MLRKCPICDKDMIIDSSACPGFEKSHCPSCPLEFQGNGNYAIIVTIDGEHFDLEDGWGDEKKYEKRIQEMKALLPGDDENEKK